MNEKRPQDNPPEYQRVLTAAAVIGAGVFLATLVMDPKRAWANLLLANFYFLGLSLFAGAFLAIQAASSAAWHENFRKILSSMAAYFPIGVALTVVFLLGARSLYYWAAPAAAQDEFVLKHAGFLNVPFFTVRAAAYLAAWFFSLRWFLEPARSRHKGRAAVFLVVFGLTFSLAAVDWLMTLVPHWASTIFPWYVFGGVLINGLAVTAVILTLLRRRGQFGAVTESQRHDLGKFVFAFSFFWGYLWFSQYMLIWYANMPEETSFYVPQLFGAWAPLFWANVVVNFVLPAAMLLFAAAKKNERVLLAAGMLLIFGHWLDLYLMIMPPVLGHSPRLGWPEAGIFIGAAALFLLKFEKALANP